MPVVLEFAQGRIKVSVYFKDHNPPHVHVRAPGAEAVYDLATFTCLRSDGFNAKTLRLIKRALVANRDALKEAWDEYQA